ncbi:transcriptional repressor [Prevotella sp. oral taxon 376]|uniref:Fur family transcriptional regulator n=1 Tax=Prevotella sp. oral taxon 376 TaxID=712466 RepID=UPI000D1FCCE9|nr:transcriptional repressor [Prevotella sp. oral taxon 376]PTL32683.1 transcriptional repressor [Prevotella sp. oral taxon 376]
MKKSSKEKAQKILDNYLETNNHRKTPERYAILEAVYSMKGHFSLDALREKLEKKHFPVSRATLYNTIKLFIYLRLVICHRLADGTKYEAINDKENHIHQICTVCGQVTELEAPKIVHAIEDTKLRRFAQEVFSLYIYGVCCSCKQKTSRL